MEKDAFCVGCRKRTQLLDLKLYKKTYETKANETPVTKHLFKGKCPNCGNTATKIATNEEIKNFKESILIFTKN